MDRAGRRELGGRSPCLEPEFAAAYVDGTLENELRREVEDHLADCSDCREFCVGTSEAVTALAAESHHNRVRPRWYASARLALVAAATVLMALIPIWLVQQQRQVPRYLGLIVEAVGPRRPIEGRLSGGFQYGPRTGQTRAGTGTGTSPPDVVIAAARLEEALSSRRDGPSLVARGAAALVLGRVDDAIAALEEARTMTPSDPAVWIDLSAAYLEKSRRVNYVEAQVFLSNAAESSARAVRLDPEAPEAWFNLATVDVARGRPATEAWQRFLRVERDPAWAAEGRRQREAAQ